MQAAADKKKQNIKCHFFFSLDKARQQVVNIPDWIAQMPWHLAIDHLFLNRDFENNL